MICETLTSSVVASRLQEVLESKFDPREWRMSELGSCPRRHVLRVVGYEADAMSEETAAYFERGNIIESWLVQQFREQYPRRVRTQVEVLGPGCTGHIDLYLATERLIVEVKTANEAAEQFGLPKPEHLYQVQAYLHFGRKHGILYNGRTTRLPDDARAEIVYFLLGRQLRYVVYPVEYSPAVGHEIECNLQALQQMAQRGELPGVPAGYSADRYPCSWRGGEVRCPFYRYCWDGQAETAPAGDAPGAEQLFRKYADTRARYGVLSDQIKAVKQQLDYLEEQLEDVFRARQVDKGALIAGGVQISRTPVAGRVTYDIESAALAGAVDLDRLAPWKRIGSGYVRWTVKEAR